MVMPGCCRVSMRIWVLVRSAVSRLAAAVSIWSLLSMRSPFEGHVIPVLGTGIHPTSCSGACGWMDTGDEPRYDEQLLHPGVTGGHPASRSGAPGGMDAWTLRPRRGEASAGMTTVSSD